MNRRESVAARIKIDGERCVYCGERATCFDHFPPYSVERFRGWLLPACAECNALAADRCPYDFEARAMYVKRELIARYRPLLESAALRASEVAELGRGLRGMVERWAAQRAILRQRTAWSAIAYLATIDPKRHVRQLEPEQVDSALAWRGDQMKPLWRKPVLLEHKPGKKRCRGPHWIERFPEVLRWRDFRMLYNLLWEAYLLDLVETLPD
jgi:hypothetical protein